MTSLRTSARPATHHKELQTFRHPKQENTYTNILINSQHRGSCIS